MAPFKPSYRASITTSGACRNVALMLLHTLESGIHCKLSAALVFALIISFDLIWLITLKPHQKSLCKYSWSVFWTRSGSAAYLYFLALFKKKWYFNYSHFTTLLSSWRISSRWCCCWWCRMCDGVIWSLDDDVPTKMKAWKHRVVSESHWFHTA